MSIAVLVPVLGRPHRAQPLVDSLAASGADARLVFLVSRDDPAQSVACKRTGAETIHVSWDPGKGDWARKINYGVSATDEPFVLLGADDLHFHPGWDVPLLKHLDHVGVVGTNDLGNKTVMSGGHSTHPAVARWYVREYGTVDEHDRAVHEGYWHNWVDTELVKTAMARGMWQFCADSRVEHLHPFWNKGTDDATYKLGQAHYHDDGKLFRQRSALWRHLRPVSGRV